MKSVLVPTIGKVNRADHIWFSTRTGFKCVTCGAVTRELPPKPTPLDWEADRYETLTPEERALCPFEN